MFALAVTSVLVGLVEEVRPWLALESVLALGVAALFIVPAAEVLLGASVRVGVPPPTGAVALLFGVAVLLRFLAASSARAAAEVSVCTKVPVLGCGTAFCVASLASCGVTPMFVVGAVVVGAVCAQAPPTVSANVAHKAKSFIE